MKYIKLLLLLISFLGVLSTLTLAEENKTPIKQCQCVLFEEKNIIVDFRKLNKSEHYLVSAFFASDKNYWASFFCVNDKNENSGAYYCMGDDDSGRMWVKTDDNGFKVKFGNIRFDTDFRNEAYEVESKYIVSEDTNYEHGKCVPCLSASDEGLYVCYNYKKSYGKGDKSSYLYEGCRRSHINCESKGEKHFGKYPNNEKAHTALNRCLNSEPKF